MALNEVFTQSEGTIGTTVADFPPLKLVYAMDNGIRHAVYARSGAHVCDRLVQVAGKRVKTLCMYVYDEHGTVAMSALGDGWHLVPTGTELLVEWEQGMTSDPWNLIKAVWTVAGTHHTPIRQTAGTITGVLTAYGNAMTPLLRLRGRDAFGGLQPMGLQY